MENNIIDFRKITILALNLKEKQPLNYQTCVRKNIFRLDDILRLSREDIRKDFNESLIRFIHSNGFYFDFEKELIDNFSIRIKSGENISINEFKYFLDLNSKLPVVLRDSNSILMRLKLLKKVNGLTTHDISVLEKIFDFDMNDIIEELKEMDNNPVLSIPINKTRIPVVASNVLSKFNIITLGDLTLLSSEEDLIRFRSIGVNTVDKIIQTVHSMGYKFVNETFNKNGIDNDVFLLNELNQLFFERKLLLEKLHELDIKIENNLNELNKSKDSTLIKVRKR